jgi:transcriptional regulator with XRE-family HTH domain
MLSQSPGQVFGQRVYETRERLGLTQQQLANRLEEIGHKPMHRMTVAKIEAGRDGPWQSVRAERVTLAETLAFAAALNVAPVHLITPLADEVPVAITRKHAARASVLRQWIRGDVPLWPRRTQVSVRDYIEWLTSRPEAELVAWITSRRLSELGPLERELVGEAVRGEARNLVERLVDPDEFKAALDAAARFDTIKREGNDG